MKEVQLTQGMIALVDDEDFELVSKYRWWPHKLKTNIYARTEYMGKRIRMHQLILPAPPGLVCDHINRNGLDNRRSNLRLATSSENIANSRPLTGKHSRYRGVAWSSGGKRRARWVARIIVKSKQILLGYYKSEITAAKAYDRAARKFFGEFASTNFA